jgi:hypothetical protein
MTLHMLTPVLLLVQVAVLPLVVARLTRLICTDKITEPLRNAAARRLPERSLLLYLLFCRWCMSVWIAVPVAAMWWAASPAPRWSGQWWLDVPTVALALSHITGLLVRAEPED